MSLTNRSKVASRGWDSMQFRPCTESPNRIQLYCLAGLWSRQARHLKDFCAERPIIKFPYLLPLLNLPEYPPSNAASRREDKYAFVMFSYLNDPLPFLPDYAGSWGG